MQSVSASRVNDADIRPAAPERTPEFRKVLVEAVIVAVVGAAIAFAANSISPRGLKLNRNYFPGGGNGLVSVPASVPPLRHDAETNQVISNPPPLSTTAANGLQMIDGRRAERLFQDPRFHQDLVVFVDARDAEHFREGHIPGAYEFDPYHPEKYIGAILPVCQAAEQIVVYCTGGDCEDSQFAAITLRDAGISNQKLFVYEGGISEWTTNALPIETGDRKSGNLRKASQ
jgi:rhodanese-related sulfurtransferase